MSFTAIGALWDNFVIVSDEVLRNNGMSGTIFYGVFFLDTPQSIVRGLEGGGEQRDARYDRIHVV